MIRTDIEKLYSISQVDSLIKAQKLSFRYSLSDVILFLLYADRHPIKGKVKQMKEIFLVLNETLFGESVQPVHFEKNRFGPYSEEVEYTIDQLVFLNLLSVNGKRNSKDFAIEITPKGISYIKRKYLELPVNIQQILKRKRAEWDTQIPQGLLKYVYTHYEEYLENSVFKERYEKLDWNNDNQRKIEKHGS
jgi:hypothetical protein